jgi:hydroxymethylpyrimidine pyrophosphatase-like HAD family hydrolase
LAKPDPETGPPGYRALAADYDGTLSDSGHVSPATQDSLRRLKAGGWRVLLVTGRHLDDLQAIFPQLALCDLVVAENGGLLFSPSTGEARTLAPPPPPALLGELERRGVRFTTGRAVIATFSVHADDAREAIAATGSNLEPIFNKDALMLLPRGVDKRSGLLAALAELNLSPDRVVGVGDAENDLPFLELCGCSVAVANAVPALQEAADVVTSGGQGEGVRELVEALLSEPQRGPLGPGPGTTRPLFLPDELSGP